MRAFYGLTREAQKSALANMAMLSSNFPAPQRRNLAEQPAVSDLPRRDVTNPPGMSRPLYGKPMHGAVDTRSTNKSTQVLAKIYTTSLTRSAREVKAEEVWSPIINELLQHCASAQ